MTSAAKQAKEKGDNLLGISLEKARLFLAFPIRAELGDFENHFSTALPESPLLQPQKGYHRHREITSIWNRCDLSISTELHPTLASLLGYAPNSDKPTYWRIDEGVLGAINRQIKLNVSGPKAANYQSTRPHGLALKLTNAARNRLLFNDDQVYVPIRIVNIDFYLSQTRLGQLVVEIECCEATVSAALIVELAHALASSDIRSTGVMIHRLSDKLAVIDEKAAPYGGQAFTLKDLVQMLACPSHDAGCAVETPRAFSYIIAVCNEKLDHDEATVLAARLARRHNADYSPRNTLIGVEIAAPFENVCHACTSEGGAVLVSDASSIRFLQNYGTGPAFLVYLPLALLAHKNLHDLVALSQGSAITVEHSERANDAVLASKLGRIELMQERLLNYRLAHRFSLAGFGVNHNLVHAAWQRAIHADTLLGEITADVDQASGYLAKARADLREKRDAKMRATLLRQINLLRILLIFLAVFEGFHTIVELVGEYWHWPTPDARAAGQLAHALGLNLSVEESMTTIEQIAKALPLILALFAAVVAFLVSRRGGDLPEG